MGRRPGLPGTHLGEPGGLLGCASGSAATPSPSLGPCRRALRPARVDGPGHCLRGTPVRTHCFGCSQVAPAPPGPSRGTPRRPPPLRPPPTAQPANPESRPAEPPNFSGTAPHPPTHARSPRLPPAGPSVPAGEGGLPRPQTILTIPKSECDGKTLYTPGARPAPPRCWNRSEAGWGGGALEERNRRSGGRAGRGSSGEGGELTSTGDSRAARGDSGGRGEAPLGPARAGGAPPLPAAPAPRPFPRSAAAGTELTPHERAEV